MIKTKSLFENLNRNKIYKCKNCKIKPFNTSEVADEINNFILLDTKELRTILNINNRARYTAFSTETGFYQWKVLPFGINIAPSSFSRMMSLAFSGLNPERVLIYMDDLIVIGFNEKKHLENLKLVFETCRKYNLKLNADKCEFFKTEVTFLGHKCTTNGILPDNSKIKAVKNYPVPKDKDEVKRFVAFMNYYRRFIPNFAEISQPLTHLTKKRIEFI